MVGEAVPRPQSRGGTAPLREVQRGRGVQEGPCEQEVTLAFSARVSPSLFCPERQRGSDVSPG